LIRGIGRRRADGGGLPKDWQHATAHIACVYRVFRPADADNWGQILINSTCTVDMDVGQGEDQAFIQAKNQAVEGEEEHAVA
jgi:hypothetical protein